MAREIAKPVTDEDRHTPITEDWLKACGFKWHQFDRQPGKHWLMWIGTAAREEGFLRSYEDLGVEVSRGGKGGEDDWWFCWLRDDAAGIYHRFIHIRHLRTRGDLALLIEGLIGYPFDPGNAPYGTLLKPEHAARVREEYERLDRRMNRERPKWSTIEEDETRSRPLPEDLEARVGRPK